MGILFLPFVETPAVGLFVFIVTAVEVAPTSSHLFNARLNRTAIRYSKVYLVHANADSHNFLLFA